MPVTARPSCELGQEGSQLTSIWASLLGHRQIGAEERVSLEGLGEETKDSKFLPKVQLVLRQYLHC